MAAETTLRTFTAAQLAQIINASTVIDTAITVQRFSTDTRHLQPGDCFIALVGETFDGHDFIAQAQAAGASCAIVSREVSTDVPCLLVQDTGKAYGEIALAYRRAFTKPIIGITGSMGKTTVKTLLAQALSQLGPVHATQANYNNQIGVPKTLLGLQNTHAVGVIEVGTNNPGEIASAAQWIEPDVALVTTVAPVHIGQFDGIAGLAAEKFSLYPTLRQGGTAIVNIDNPITRAWLPQLREDYRVITYGLDAEADVQAQAISHDECDHHSFDLCVQGQRLRIQAPLPCAHTVNNILAAAAVMVALDCDLAQLQDSLNALAPLAGRMQTHKGLHDALIIDDSYSGAPDAVKAALQHLAQYRGETIMVLGDMLELGELAEPLHREVGQLARELGIKQLYTYGNLSEFASTSFGNGSQHFTTQADLVAALAPCLSAQTTCLIKGSRSMHMENIVSQVTSPL